jgi:hypothetical protein
MKYEPILRQPAQDPESLSGEFGLILDAFADAFRSLSSTSRQECRCSKIHFAGWR